MNRLVEAREIVAVIYNLEELPHPEDGKVKRFLRLAAYELTMVHHAIVDIP